MDYVEILKYGNKIIITFNIEHNKPFNIGEKMNELCEDAYMNGYNWGAFFNYYLGKNYPEILEGINFDSEAGMFTAYCDYSLENEIKAEKFKEIIRDLVENEEKLYKVIKVEAANIEWD